MTYWTAILLGLIQGLAEFLPISSSGHLAILQNFLRIGDLENQMLFDVLLHLGTLGAVIFAYHTELRGLCREGLMLLHLEIAKVSMELSTDEATTVKNGTFIYNGNVKLSTTVPTMDVEVKYAVDTDASLVDAYNKANGTSYLAAPAGFASTVAAFVGDRCRRIFGRVRLPAQSRQAARERR